LHHCRTEFAGLPLNFRIPSNFKFLRMKIVQYLFASVSLLSFLLICQPCPDAQVVAAQKESPRTSGAGKALDNWAVSRAYPGQTINLAAWSEAAMAWKEMASTDKTASTQWESMGPHNIGGRTLRLAFNPQNPNTLYAGSAGGGLWRSHTAGIGATAWHHIPTGFPVLGVAAVAISPIDSNIIVIGTGELYNDGKTGDRVNVRLSRGTYGIGILRSSDNGQTWAHVLNWAYDDLRGVQDIAFSPYDANNVLAATSEGIYQSSDAGLTWTLRTNQRMANDILFHPNDSAAVMVAVGNLGSLGAGIYTSADGGASYNMVGAGLPAFSGKVTLSSTKNAPYWVYASVADSLTGYGLFRSTDWGNTWTSVASNDFQTYQGWYSHDIAVNPWNRNELAFGGVDAWTSSNAGQSIYHATDWSAWFLYSTPPIGGAEGPSNFIHGDIHNIIYHPSDSNQIYFATDGGVFRSIDGGTVYEGLNGMYQTTQFYAEFSNSNQDSNFAIGGLQDNATAVYQGSKAWYRVIGGDGCCAAIDPGVDDYVYASTQNATIWNSTDRAFSFNYMNNQPTRLNSAPFVTSFALCPESPLTIYACTDMVAVSGDGGGNWSGTNGNSVLNGNNVIKVAIAEGSGCSTVFASVASGPNGRTAIFRTLNGGGSWVDITGTLPDRYFHEFAIDPTNSDIVYVALGGYNSNHLYKSIDQGNTWFSVGIGLPNVPGNTVVIDPANPSDIFFGNDVGVFYSPDGGQNWAPFGNGLPEAMIAMDLSISKADRKLRVATHGSGVYQVDLPGPPTAIQPIAASLHYASVSPNPCSSVATISFDLQKRQSISIKVVDQNGRMVRQVCNAVPFGIGKHTQELDVNGWAAGIYFIVLEGAGKKTAIRLAVL
jgi:hypothetical protein